MKLRSKQVRDYLFAEFFALYSLSKYAQVYGCLYGDGAVKYLYKTFKLWQSGVVQMSASTEFRVLTVMPKILDEAKRFHVLSLYLDEALVEHRKVWGGAAIRFSELASCTQSRIDAVILETYELDWFVKDVYSIDDLTSFSDLVRWSVVEFARTTYEWALLDIKALAPIKPPKNGALKIVYVFRLWNARLVTDTICPKETPLSIENLTFALDGDLKEHFRKALIERGLDVYDKSYRALNSRELLIQDITALLEKSKNVPEGVQFTFNLSAKLATADVEVVVCRRNRLLLATACLAPGIVLFGLVAGGSVWLTKDADLLWLGLLGICGILAKRFWKHFLEWMEYEQQRKTWT